MESDQLLCVVPRTLTKIANLSGKFDAAIYAAMAFPFVLQVLPGYDTQPTFILLFVAGFVFLASQRTAFLVEWARRPLQLWAVIMLLLGVLISILANEQFFSSAQRIISFLLFFFSLLFGLGKTSIVTENRLRITLYIYAFFTIIYFLSQGLIESILIASRGGMFSGYFDSGRGASTLSPEPSFFAIQLASLFLLFFLSRRNLPSSVLSRLNGSERGLVLMCMALLVATLSGYGALYFLLLALMVGRTWAIFLAVVSAPILLFLSDSLNFRIINLMNLVRQEGLVGILLDASIGERLRSFYEYLGIFSNTIFGNAFQNLGGGGLVSVLAGTGIFSIPFFGLLLCGLVRLRQPVQIKIFAATWLLFTSISGPIGVPLVGILAGQLMRNATLRRAPV